MHTPEIALTNSARALGFSRVLYLDDCNSHSTTEPSNSGNSVMPPPCSLPPSSEKLLGILSDFSRPGPPQNQVPLEVWKDGDISRLASSVYENENLWQDYGDSGGSPWMRFVSHTMRSLIPDAYKVASNFSCSHTNSDYPVRLIVSRTSSQDHSPLPILCMSDDNQIIVSMVHTALTHCKQAGRYDCPTIGLLLPPSGKYCHVLLGWLSKPPDSTSYHQDTAEVYLVIPHYPDTFHPRGVFDLTTFDGARAFASFLEQCGTHITSLPLLPHMQEVQEVETRGASVTGLRGPSVNARIRAWQSDINGVGVEDLLLWRGLFPGGTVPEEHLIPSNATAMRKSRQNIFLPLMEKTIWADVDGTDEILEDSDGDLDGEVQNHPGILEWSLDHHLCTLPFISRLGRDSDHTEHKAQPLEDLCNLLGSHWPQSMTDLPDGFDDEVLAMLVPEMGWLCCNEGRRCICWQMSWHEIVRRYYWLPRSQQGGAAQTTFINAVDINLSRCPEYDQRIIGGGAVTHPDYSHADRLNNDLFPYTPLLNSLEKWEELLVKAHKERRRVEAHWDANSDEFQQMDSAIKHLWQAESMILDDRTIFSGSALPECTEARTLGIGLTVKAFKIRVGHYPLEDSVDGAVTVMVENFCRTLEAHISSNSDLQDNLLFFKTSGDNQYHLPVLLIEHQNEGRELHAATNNVQRMHCTSAVLFLASLGIKDFPVYGLSTYGPHGLLSRTWYSEEDNCCYTVDQVPAKYHFDIATRHGIMRCMSFLGKMRAHAENLQLRFESVKKSVVEKLSTSEGRESLRWTLRAQVKRFAASELTASEFEWE